MEYIAFDKGKMELYYRDGITHVTNRVTLRVESLEITETCYKFKVKSHDKLKISQINFPVHNTVLIYV